jgi:hypothetical protein
MAPVRCLTKLARSYLERPSRKPQIDCCVLKRVILISLVLIVAAIAGCGGGSDSSSDTTGTVALTSCNINGKQRDFNASYVTSLQVSKATCPQAEEVIAMYHHCRLQTGHPDGTCDTPVRGFTCTEGPRQTVPGVQYNGTVDCRNGDLEIRSTYTQNF